MQTATPGIGQRVVVRDQRWSVAGVDVFDDCFVLRLEGIEATNAGRRWSVVAPFDRIHTIAADPVRRKRRRVLRHALAGISRERPALGLWSARSARIDLLPYQLEPALAVLRGSTRLLLADAVGLGKTIQAGLIVAELLARGLIERVLILTPAGLRDTWSRELRERFAIEAMVLDQAAFHAGASAFEAGVNPWSWHRLAIASIDLAKRVEVLAAIDEVPFDLLIVDEAHHLTPASDRLAIVERVARRTPWVVMLSATPHSGDSDAFNALCAIGASGDGLTVFRRTRLDIGLSSRRRTHLLDVVPNGDEVALHAAVDRYTTAIWRGRARDSAAVRLVAITLARRAASSAMALEKTLIRRLELLSNGARLERQPLLPWDDIDRGDDCGDDALLQLPGLHDADAEFRCLNELIGLAKRAGEDSSKLRRVRRLIERTREPMVVFTEYRDTLSGIARVLSGSIRVACIHGGIPASMRHEIVDLFNRGSVDLLLATDTAGEGLSLHHRCRLIVDMELPWNPRRLEQRVGRVDRLGQQRRVHAIHLIHRGTIEDTVLARLERRRRQADEAFADDWSELSVAAAVFDGVTPRPQPVSVPTTRIDDAIPEAERLRRQRLQCVDSRDPSFDRPMFTTARHGRAREVHALLAITHRTSAGRAVDVTLRAATLDLTAPPRTATAWARIATRLTCELPLRETIVGADRHLQIDRQLGALRNAVADRIGALRARLHATAPAAYQASLFDRRAERAARARHDAIARIDRALAATSARVSAHPADTPDVELIALWPPLG